MIEVSYLFLFALLVAALEVQIEGKDGWAQNLPTWRPGKSIFGKEITGYHLLIFALFLAVLHYPYFAGKIWTLSSEFTVLSLFSLLLLAEDFFWFVINPHYGLRRFKKEHISWHKNWFLFLPRDYWLGAIISALFYGLSILVK